MAVVEDTSNTRIGRTALEVDDQVQGLLDAEVTLSAALLDVGAVERHRRNRKSVGAIRENLEALVELEVLQGTNAGSSLGRGVDEHILAVRRRPRRCWAVVGASAAGEAADERDEWSVV